MLYEICCFSFIKCRKKGTQIGVDITVHCVKCGKELEIYRLTDDGYSTMRFTLDTCDRCAKRKKAEA